VEKNQGGFSLDQIICSQTGHVAWILVKFMAVQILFNVTIEESTNQTMFPVALTCFAHL